MLAPILRLAATAFMFALAAAVYCLVCPLDAYAAEVARKTDSLTFKIICAYLILAFVCWGVFWIVATGGGKRRDD